MGGLIDPRDVEATLALRRAVYAGDAVVTREEFVQLLKAGCGAGDAVPREFDELLTEAAIDLVALQAEPAKYVSQGDADWLVAQLNASAGLAWRTERAMLVGLSRVAVSLPPSFSRYIMKRFESVAVSGHVAAGGVDHEAGAVTAEDLEALRVVIFSATEGSALHVTREEAESLFRIVQKTRADETPGFVDFFAKAIGNYLMGVAFDRGMSRDKAIEVGEWLDAPAPSFPEFVGAMVAGASVDKIFQNLREGQMSVEDGAEAFYRADNAEDEALMQKNGKIDVSETQWLMTQLTRAGDLTASEKALLRFLKEESPQRTPGLDALIAAKAA